MAFSIWCRDYIGSQRDAVNGQGVLFFFSGRSLVGITKASQTLDDFGVDSLWLGLE